MLKKLFRTAVCLITVAGCLCVGAQAAGINITETGTGGRFTVEGTATAGDWVVLNVFKQTGADWEKSPLKDVKKELVFHDLDEADETGAYQFTVDVQAETGEYVAYLYAGTELLGSSTFGPRQNEEIEVLVCQEDSNIDSMEQLQKDKAISIQVSTAKLDDYPDSVVLFACYQNERLVHVQVASMEDLGAGSEAEYATWNNLETNQLPEFNRIKVFVWSDFVKMSPLGKKEIN